MQQLWEHNWYSHGEILKCRFQLQKMIFSWQVSQQYCCPLQLSKFLPFTDPLTNSHVPLFGKEHDWNCILAAGLEIKWLNQDQQGGGWNSIISVLDEADSYWPMQRTSLPFLCFLSFLIRILQGHKKLKAFSPCMKSSEIDLCAGVWRLLSKTP